MPDTPDPAAAALDVIRADLRIAADGGLHGIKAGDYLPAALARHSRALLKAVEAALDQADDLTRKSEALDAEAEYIAGEHPEAAAVAVLKRERSIAYDECARWFREAITAALTGKGAEPDLSAELDAAEEIVMGRAETVVTEWGVRTPSGHVTKIGSGEEAAQMARTLAGDWEQEGHPEALVRRTVTYGPWESPENDEEGQPQ